MSYREIVILSLLSLLALGACSPAVSPSVSPTLSKLGPNMQDQMHEALGLSGSLTTPLSAKPIDPNV